MVPSSDSTFRPLRYAIAGALVVSLMIPCTLLSIRAWAGDDDKDTAFRLYFAVPFIATGDRQPTRLGFQLMSEIDSDAAYSPLQPGNELSTTLDLGFTRDGLAKFDVNGADARGAYEVFARAIGLTPDEIELCRESDCLDWVKAGEKTPFMPATRLGDE